MNSNDDADDDLREKAEEMTSGEPTVIYRPILIVENTEGGKQLYRINLAELDQLAHSPKVFGIMLSDLTDHVAAAYADATGRDARDVRAEVVRTFRDEDRFKEKEPGRGRIRGVTVIGGTRQ